MNYSHKLYIKLAVAIGIGAILFACISSYLLYFMDLEEVKGEHYEIVEQLAKTVEKAASIAVYIEDPELKREIVEGLSNNILISFVDLKGESDSEEAIEESLINAQEVINLQLAHPFISSIMIGELNIYPDVAYIQEQAQAQAQKHATRLIIHSIIIAILVSFFVHQLLTKPLQKLTDTFSKVDPARPHTMDLPKYHREDEIGVLATGINGLMKQLRLYIENEKTLRRNTQMLERKFRLIFERASAGIGLIDDYNKLVTSNYALDSLLFDGEPSDYHEFTSMFQSPKEVLACLDNIRRDSSINNIAVDFKKKSKVGTKASLMHCLFSTVKEDRKEVRGRGNPLIEVIMYDVTDRAFKEMKTRFEADHDALTLLKNRRCGKRELASLLSQCLGFSDHMILMMIDLDKFKPINDIHGHDAGDSVLMEVGRRFMKFFNQKDDVCIRWGGDEFVIGRSIEDYDKREIKMMLESLLRKIRTPIILENGQSCQIGASIGVAITPAHGTQMVTLLASADKAMYQVKDLGRNSYLIADTEKEHDLMGSSI